MSSNSMSFGSHGYNHYWWQYLNNNDQNNEIEMSLKYFQKLKILDHNFSVCYPYGSYNNETIKIMKSHNISFCLTTTTGSVNATNMDKIFTLPRYDTNDFT